MDLLMIYNRKLNEVIVIQGEHNHYAHINS